MLKSYMQDPYKVIATKRRQNYGTKYNKDLTNFHLHICLFFAGDIYIFLFCVHNI